jgi:hypothetical protein
MQCTVVRTGEHHATHHRPGRRAPHRRRCPRPPSCGRVQPTSRPSAGGTNTVPSATAAGALIAAPTDVDHWMARVAASSAHIGHDGDVHHHAQAEPATSSRISRTARDPRTEQLIDVGTQARRGRYSLRHGCRSFREFVALRRNLRPSSFTPADRRHPTDDHQHRAAHGGASARPAQQAPAHRTVG